MCTFREDIFCSNYQKKKRKKQREGGHRDPVIEKYRGGCLTKPQEKRVCRSEQKENFKMKFHIFSLILLVMAMESKCSSNR